MLSLAQDKVVFFVRERGVQRADRDVAVDHGADVGAGVGVTQVSDERALQPLVDAVAFL